MQMEAALKGSPGGSVVRNPPAKAGDVGSMGPGRFPQTVEQWSPGTTPTESTCCNYWSLCVLQPELHTKRRHHDEKPPQLEKKQQWKSNMAKSQYNFFKKLPWNTTPHYQAIQDENTVALSLFLDENINSGGQFGRFLKTKHATIIWHSICTPGHLSQRNEDLGFTQKLFQECEHQPH